MKVMIEGREVHSTPPTVFDDEKRAEWMVGLLTGWLPEKWFAQRVGDPDELLGTKEP